jgi:hypothetical protein
MTEGMDFTLRMEMCLIIQLVHGDLTVFMSVCPFNLYFISLNSNKIQTNKRIINHALGELLWFTTYLKLYIREIEDKILRKANKFYLRLHLHYGLLKFYEFGIQNTFYEMPLSFMQKRKIARSCSKYTATNYANLRPTLNYSSPRSLSKFVKRLAKRKCFYPL